MQRNAGTLPTGARPTNQAARPVCYTGSELSAHESNSRLQRSKSEIDVIKTHVQPVSLHTR